jgi:SAM-dependent methyltransferase
MDAWMPNWAMPAGSGDRWAEDYECSRPGWPESVTEIAPVERSGVALELAAGTGKLTRLLVGTFDSVVAVEPAAAMRRILIEKCPSVDVRAGSAEAIPLADASVEAVFAAEAFTHFDGKRAVAEIARVLRPDGAVVLLWNLPAGPWEPSIAEVEAFLNEIIETRGLKYAPLDLGPTAYTSGAWRDSFASSQFHEHQAAKVANPQTLDRDGLVTFFASMGWIADLPDTERLPLLDEVSSLLKADRYRRVWETHIHWARLPSANKPRTFGLSYALIGRSPGGQEHEHTPPITAGRQPPERTMNSWA